MKVDTQPKLEYINHGPCGYVVYKNGEHELKFFFEFGGGDCVAIIHVPTVEDWTYKTKLDVTERGGNLLIHRPTGHKRPGTKLQLRITVR